MSSKNKKIKSIILISLSIIFVLLFPVSYISTNYKSDIKLFFTGEPLAYDKVVKSIYLNNMELAYDSTNETYYYSINNAQNTLDLKFTLDSYHGNNNFVYLKDYGIENEYKDVEIEYNKEYKIIVDSTGIKYEKKLIFTNVPVVKISVDKKIEEDYVTSKTSIQDSTYKTGDDKYLINTNSQIRLRGSSTLYFPKKSYRIKLLDESYENLKLSLLDMDKSDKWILIPAYNDSSKIRDRVCFDIWNEMNSYNMEEQFNIDQKGEFIELFVNNKYEGLYQLKEVINAEKLNLNSDGILVKGVNYGDSNLDNIDTKSIVNYEMKFPENMSDYTSYWQKILPYIENYPNFEQQENFEEKIFDKYYVKNLIDYRILINLFRAQDNFDVKNIYVSLNGNENKAMITPWDLDLTFGYSFTEDYSEEVRARKEEKESYIDPIVGLYYNNANKYNNLVKQRWQELRKEVITYENISLIIDNYCAYLKEAGAITREYEMWEKGKNFDDETNNMKIWINKRIEYLDEQIGGV